jgi:hypothetical protein
MKPVAARGDGNRIRFPSQLVDCFPAPQAAIPHPSRPFLHRLLQRHDISHLPQTEGNKLKKFRQYSIGYFYTDIAEVRAAEGKLHVFAPLPGHPSSFSQSCMNARRRRNRRRANVAPVAWEDRDAVCESHAQSRAGPAAMKKT